MFKSPRSESVVVVTFLGLFLILGSEDTSLAAGFQRDGDGAEAPTAKLAFYDSVGLDPDVVAATQGEVEAIFLQVGLTVEWVDTQALSNGMGPTEGSYVKVMLCAEPYRTWVLPEGTMGHAPGGTFPRPVVYVFESRVREALKGGKRRFLASDPATLGRALGRAIAHEVVHSLTPEPFHSRSGLMRAAQDDQTLTCQEVELDDRSIAEARKGLTLMRELSLGPSDPGGTVRRAIQPSGNRT